MEISSNLIFYQILKVFPDAVHYLPKNYCVKRPMFWGNPEKMNGHFVVIEASEMIHLVHHYKDTVFLCAGYDLTQLRRCHSECIVIPQEIPLPQLFNQILEIFDRFYQWEDALETAVSQNFSFDSIIRSCDELLDDPMALVDTQFRYVGYSRRLAFENHFEERYVGDQQYLTLEDINQLTSMPDFKPLEKKHGVFEYVCIENCLHMNIFYQEQYVGRLALPNTRHPAKKAYYKQILQIVADYVEVLYARFGTFWHRKASDTQLKQLLTLLVTVKPVEKDMLFSCLADRGFSPSDQYLLIQFQSHAEPNLLKTHDILSIHLENSWPGAICLTHEDHLLLFLNLTFFSQATGKIFYQELALFLRESLLLAGISREFSNFYWMPAAYQQTNIALTMGKVLNPMYWYFKFDDYAFSYLLRHGYGNFLPEQICSPAITILEEYDKKNNTQLRETLQTFLNLQCHAVSTAKELCIARSTFLKRLERIQQLTGIHLEDAATRIYLELSYEIYKIHW